MKTRYGWVLLGLIAVAIGCSSYRVSHDYDTGTDLAGLETYDWMPQPPEAPGSVAGHSLIEGRVKNAVNTRLAAKGVRRDSQNPDFLIVYHVSTKDRVRVRNYTFISDKKFETYEEGTLVLDFLAPNGKSLLWRGVAERTLDSNPTPEKIDKRINEAVEKILEGFPPS
jgi:hypothetical protein